MPTSIRGTPVMVEWAAYQPHEAGARPCCWSRTPATDRSGADGGCRPRGPRRASMPPPKARVIAFGGRRSRPWPPQAFREAAKGGGLSRLCRPAQAPLAQVNVDPRAEAGPLYRRPDFLVHCPAARIAELAPACLLRPEDETDAAHGEGAPGKRCVTGPRDLHRRMEKGHGDVTRHPAFRESCKKLSAAIYDMKAGPGESRRPMTFRKKMAGRPLDLTISRPGHARDDLQRRMGRSSHDRRHDLRPCSGPLAGTTSPRSSPAWP